MNKQKFKLHIHESSLTWELGEGESTSRPSKSPVAKGYYTTVVVGEPIQSAPPEERTGRSGGAMTNGGGDDGWERRARRLREDEA